MEITAKVSQEHVEEVIKEITNKGCTVLAINPIIDGQFQINIVYRLPVMPSA